MRLLSRSQLVSGGRRYTTSLVVVTMASLLSVGCGTRVEDSLDGVSGSVPQQAAAVDGHSPSQASAPSAVEHSAGGAGATVATGGSLAPEEAPQRNVATAPAKLGAAPRPGDSQSDSGRGAPTTSGGGRPVDPEGVRPKDSARVQPEDPVRVPPEARAAAGAVDRQRRNAVRARRRDPRSGNQGRAGMGQIREPTSRCQRPYRATRHRGRRW